MIKRFHTRKPKLCLKYLSSLNSRCKAQYSCHHQDHHQYTSMSFLGYFTDEDLRQLLIIKKVDISIAIDKVFPFLYGLRDNQLITAEKFKEISKLQKQISKAMYSLLQSLEKSDSSTIREFWLNLFQDYNLQMYPKLYPLKASLIEVLDKDVPVVKTGLCVTGKRKYPDEECADHSVSGRTQKDVEEQIPECSTDPNWKSRVEQRLVRKDGKPNVTEIRNPPALLGKVDCDSNLQPVSSGDLTGELDKTQLAPGKKSVEKQLVKKDDKKHAMETRKSPSLLGKVDFGSNKLPVCRSGLTGLLDKTQSAPGKRSVEKQLTIKDGKPSMTKTRKPPSLFGKVDCDSNLQPVSRGDLIGELGKTQLVPGIYVTFRVFRNHFPLSYLSSWYRQHSLLKIVKQWKDFQINSLTGSDQGCWFQSF
ncbi:nuclear body protein SP140-like protein [Scyliorhinus canicula]|uniref:nuclear body protein SP140-like protein n=1 Tax=Scyliorhinus canicula TaxID=7830 RepID=UPI0018F3C8D1|nr:nuclear body protein SP140-like protein [Scyliorhinus canicula]